MTIDELAKNLQQWRKNKKAINEKIPEEFWREAVKHAKRTKKPCMVAKKLQLGANDLKKKMGLPVMKRKYSNKIKFQELKIHGY